MAQDTGSAPAEILHTATVVLTVLLVSAVAALAAILITWSAARLIRTRRARRHAALRLIPPERRARHWPGSQRTRSSPARDSRC